MTTPGAVLDRMRSFLGTGEQPAGSNCNAISRWYGLGCVPWCAETVSKAFAEAGAPTIRYALCQTGWNNFTSGRWGHVIGRHDAVPAGAIVFYDWNGGGWMDHTGMVEVGSPAGASIVTIEGNSGDVCRRARRSRDHVAGFGWPAVYSGHPGPPPKPPVPRPGQIAVDGVFGPETVRKLQGVLGVAVDGLFGPVSKRALQRHLHVQDDGQIGPVTVRALQARVGATVDGQWGRGTTMALQRHLNANDF
jgi:peptidoglycan hydrolase-like protein with peptidoglycan-binding domain